MGKRHHVEREDRYPLTVDHYLDTASLRASIREHADSAHGHALRLVADPFMVRTQVMGMVSWGYVVGGSAQGRCVQLTREGWDSVGKLAPPPAREQTEKEWAAELASTLAQRHMVSVHAMLRGHARTARAALVQALRERGWPEGRARMHFGLIDVGGSVGAAG